MATVAPDSISEPQIMTLDIASPCRGICKIDEPTQLCAGCLRSIDEITRWTRMDEDQKLAVLSACLLRSLNDTRQHDTGDTGSQAAALPTSLSLPGRES